MNQIAGQISLNDFLSEKVHLGWTKETSLGKVIPFQNLKDFIEKKVIYKDALGQKVVIIKNYFSKSDTFYSYGEAGTTKLFNDYIAKLQSSAIQKKLKVAFVCDRIAYTDDDRTRKTNSWLSEAFCTNGRYQVTHDASSVCFYEYKAI